MIEMLVMKINNKRNTRIWYKLDNAVLDLFSKRGRRTFQPKCQSFTLCIARDSTESSHEPYNVHMTWQIHNIHDSMNFNVHSSLYSSETIVDNTLGDGKC